MLEEQDAKKMSQYELELKLDRMAQRAFGDRDKIQKPPRKPLSEVDIEVIKEYQKQFNEPVTEYLTEIDPETGEEIIVLDENGKPKLKLVTKKFRVVPPPELEVVEIMKLAPIPTDEELAIGQENELAIRDEIRQLEQEFKDMQKQRKKLIKDIDEQNPPFQEPPRFFQETYLGKPQPRGNPNYARDLARVEALREDAVDYINEFEDMLEQIRSEIIYLTDLYQERVRDLRMVGQNVQRNEAEIASVKKINKDRIKEYQETLNRLNQGAFQQDQMPGETEEDYVARLQANAEQEYIDETKEEALIDVKRRFKEALKKLIRDDVKIEQVANSIRINELEIKNEVLKQFPLFKRKFLELYGLNNKSLDQNDILTFVNAFVKSIKGDDALLNYLGVDVKNQRTEEYTLERAEQDKKKILIMTSPNGRKLYWRLAQYYDNNDDELLEALYSFTGKRQSYNVYEASIDNKIIKAETGITAKFINQFFENKEPYILLEKKLEPTTEYDEPFELAVENTGENEFIIGWGIKQEEVPEIVPFGKIKIALNKLFYKNILSARHNNLGRIAGFQNAKVSDDFVAIIMKMIKGEKVIKQEIDSLKKTEQMLYDTLLSLANLHKRVPNNKDATITAMKERMDLIGGEIDAGNDNRALVKELYNIVHALKNFGVISNKEATKYLSQF